MSDVESYPGSPSLDPVQSLEEALSHRPRREDLCEKHILEPIDEILDPSLVPTACELENLLAHRVNREELEQRNVLLTGPEVESSLVASCLALEKQLKRNVLEHKLRDRPDIIDLEARNILHETDVTMDHSLAGIADHLNDLLSQRREASDLVDLHILPDPKVDPSLVLTQEHLQHALARDSIFHQLEHRSKREDLVQRGILPDVHVDDVLASSALALESKLSHRANREDLIEKHILTDIDCAMDSDLAPVAHELQSKLSQRPIRDDLYDRHILVGKPDIDPSLVASQVALETNLKRDNLEHLLQKRSAEEELRARGILPDIDIDPALVAPALALREKLSHRARLEDLASRNILNRIDLRVDGDLAPTAQNLENLLLHRPPRELLEEKNIVHGPPGVDPSVQAARDELSRAQRRDVLAHQLRARPSPEDLRDRGWLPDEGVDPGLASIQRDLATAQKRDQLDRYLRARPSPENVRLRGFLHEESIDDSE